MTFLELKKHIKRNMVITEKSPEIRIAVLGDSATQMLSLALKADGAKELFNFNVLDNDYNQIDSQLLDPSSETSKFAPEFVLLYLSTEKLYEHFCERPLSTCDSLADDIYGKITSYWEAVAAMASNPKIIQTTFVETNDRLFGSGGAKIANSFIFQLKKLNFLIMQGAVENKSVYIADFAAISMDVGYSNLHDPKIFCSAKTAFKLDALPDIVHTVTDVIKSVKGMVKKCVVLDLDNTIWGGVVGDDGLNGIEIGELGGGHAFSDFQGWLKKLRERGILLAVCSKNNEDTAKEPFEKHPDMLLKLSDISIFIANWEDKASNIRHIQKVLNIGMDSLVFVDDNPFERNLVRQMIPEITVPELPEDPALYRRFLQALNLFETSAYTKADDERTEQYKAESERVMLQQSFESIDDYLISLNIRAEAKPFDSFNIPRIAQLSQRSNQFNLRTVRYTESEIAAINADENYIDLYFTLADKFGSHGLVSAIIIKCSEKTAFIENWFMSCRVLKRSMEEFIINTAVSAARKKGINTLNAEYIPTPKNAMVKDIYEKLGFTRTNEYSFTLDTTEFQENETFVALK